MKKIKKTKKIRKGGSLKNVNPMKAKSVFEKMQIGSLEGMFGKMGGKTPKKKR